MPELPEVETIVKGIIPMLEGNRITTVSLKRKDLRFPFPKNMQKVLEGGTIEHIDRRAKYILCHLDNGWVWVIHLGMSGKVLLHKAMPNKLLKHDHVVVRFQDGAVLVYNDARRFGFMTVIEETKLTEHPLFQHLGLEPLSGQLTAEKLKQLMKNKSCNIKAALMDARLVVGVGNIYASESLFRAGISPNKKAGKLTQKEADKLVPAIKNVLKEAIKSGGSTLRDYVRSSGDMGYFQHRFNVYGKENEPCIQCGGKIKRVVQQGRSTFYCPTCQSGR